MSHRFVQILAAIPQLVLYGLVALPMLLVWVTVAILGVSTALVGIGFVLLAINGFVLFGLAWLEERRVAWTFRLNIPEHRMRRSQRTDGWRVIDTIGQQWLDSRSWIALVHGSIIGILGVLSVLAVIGLGMSVGWMTAPIRGADFWVAFFDVRIASWQAGLLGLLGFVLAGGTLFGLGTAHRAISRQLLEPNLEGELRAVATEQSQRRTQAMNAAEIERTRIERDLHDGVQPRLVAVAMTLGMAKRKLRTDPDAAERLIDEAHASTKTAVTELRQLVRGIHPAVLQDRGLDAALSALVGRSAIPVEIQVDLHRRYPSQVEAAMYFAVAESLTNAAKHSGASAVRVLITEHAGSIWARIDDNGCGGARMRPGGGLDGVQSRITAIGGTIEVTSPEGGPTTIDVSVPIEGIS